MSSSQSMQRLIHAYCPMMSPWEGPPEVQLVMAPATSRPWGPGDPWMFLMQIEEIIILRIGSEISLVLVLSRFIFKNVLYLEVINDRTK